MKNKSYLFISCDEAKHICDKAQYNEASFWEKLKLNIRYLWCHVTKSYVNRNKKLTKAVTSSRIECLKNSEKLQLKKALQEKLEN